MCTIGRQEEKGRTRARARERVRESEGRGMICVTHLFYDISLQINSREDSLKIHFVLRFVKHVTHFALREMCCNEQPLVIFSCVITTVVATVIWLCALTINARARIQFIVQRKAKPEREVYVCMARRRFTA